MADRGPPGGEPARASVDEVVLEAAVESPPDSGPEFTGEAGRAEDWARKYGQHSGAGQGEQRHEDVLLTCCCSRESVQLVHTMVGDGDAPVTEVLCDPQSCVTQTLWSQGLE